MDATPRGWHVTGRDVADMNDYWMNVSALDGTPIIYSYTWSEWLDGVGVDGYDTDP